MPSSPFEVGEATAAAALAAPVLRRSAAADRARWLAAVADALDAAASELLPLAEAETHLDAARLAGELARTTRQLRFFGEVIRDGGYLEAAVDHARPDAAPPTPDLRRMLVPIGPVAVFSASNFPFAFSVAGGDTASALAAGSPVVVKGHSAHARLSQRTAELVHDALAAAGAPAGTFGHVTGREAGVALVTDRHIAAVGFTGSLAGGRALFDLAVGRPDPIPFYGELGSVNPVVITAEALRTRGEGLAAGLAGSFQLGAGQYCTKPGIVFVPRGGGFAERVARHLASASATLLSETITTGFRDGLDTLVSLPGMAVHGTPEREGIRPLVLATRIEHVLENPSAHLVECFGPVTVVVEYTSPDEVLAAIRAIGGSLTATLHGAPGEDLATIADELSMIAGRVLFDGWPTGVAVGWAQQHGGPWPSSTAPHTSVGASAIRRFLRPVAWQSAPDELLPPELREDNPLGIPRRVDGTLVLAAREGGA
jgi:NADP-dependent aldehyde dehydrogenase